MSIDPNDKLILVMGMTGAGKTTFINEATGSNLLVSHDVKSCTDKVTLSEPVEIQGHKIRLVDTPGYDDTYISDAEIFKRVAEFLATVYKENKHQMIGAIYLHDVNHPIEMGSSTRGINYFKSTLGEDAAKNTYILITHWKSKTDPGYSDQLAKQQDRNYKVLKRGVRISETEEETSSGGGIVGPFSPFSSLLNNGATMLKYERITNSAREIVDAFISNPGISLLIQTETVDEKKRLKRTTGGRDANTDIKSRIKEAESLLRKSKKQVKKAPETRYKERAAKDVQAAKQSLETYKETRRALGRRVNIDEHDKK